MTNITMEKVAKYVKKYHGKDYDTPRKFENAVKREYEKLMKLYNKPLVKEIVVKMEWKKNNVWSGNPTGTAYVQYENGATSVITEKMKMSLSSFGYARDSALLEIILNKVARQNLYHKRLSAYKNKNKGFWVGSNGLSRHYSLDGTEGEYSFFTIKRTAWTVAYGEFVIKFR